MEAFPDPHKPNSPKTTLAEETAEGVPESWNVEPQPVETDAELNAAPLNLKHKTEILFEKIQNLLEKVNPLTDKSGKFKILWNGTSEEPNERYRHFHSGKGIYSTPYCREPFQAIQSLDAVIPEFDDELKSITKTIQLLREKEMEKDFYYLYDLYNVAEAAGEATAHIKKLKEYQAWWHQVRLGLSQ